MSLRPALLQWQRGPKHFTLLLPEGRVVVQFEF